MSCVKNDTKSMRSTSIGSDCTVARVPVDHVKLPVRDLGASRDFYSAALAPFGYKLVYEAPSRSGSAWVTAVTTTSRSRSSSSARVGPAVTSLSRRRA